MNLRSHSWLAALVVGLTVGWGAVANAAGTAAGNSINNRATVQFDVLGATQPTIESSPTGNSTSTGSDTSFVVDDKVDFTVTETTSSYTSVTASETDAVLTFRVQNDGNRVHDFLLSLQQDPNATAGPFGGTDSFDALNVQIFVDTNDDDVYTSGADTATFIDELAPDTHIEVFIVGDIPGGLGASQLALAHLSAQVAAGGSGGSQGAAITTDDDVTPDNIAGIDIVFADGAGSATGDVAFDGIHSDVDGWQMPTAQITVTKRSTVTDDGIVGNSATNKKPIPGATVEYEVEVANAASATAPATDIIVTDDLTQEINVDGELVFQDSGYGAGLGIQVEIVNTVTSTSLSTTNLTTALDGDSGEFTTTPGPAGSSDLRVDSITLQPGESAFVRFRVTIQ